MDSRSRSIPARIVRMFAWVTASSARPRSSSIFRAASSLSTRLLLRLIRARDVRTEDSLRASDSRRALRSLIWPLMRFRRCSNSVTLWDWEAGARPEDVALAGRDDWERRPEQGRMRTARTAAAARTLRIAYFIAQLG